MAAKILVVEDDRDMAEAIRLTLENAGYQVVNAYNPDEAWEKVSAEKPDLIVLDIMMPTGTEASNLFGNSARPKLMSLFAMSPSSS